MIIEFNENEILDKLKNNSHFLLNLCIQEKLENNEHFYSFILSLLKERKISAYNIGFSDINNLMNDKILLKYLDEIIQYPINSPKEKIYKLIAQKYSQSELKALVLNRTLSVHEFIDIYNVKDPNYGYVLKHISSKIHKNNFEKILNNITLFDINFLNNIINNSNNAIKILSADIIVNLCNEANKHELPYQALDFAYQKYESYENMLTEENLPTFFKIYGNLINSDINIQLDLIGKNSAPTFFENTKDTISGKRKTKILIFSDLLKAALDSNSQSILNCANILQTGDKIFYDIIINQKSISALTEDDIATSKKYIKYLFALYELSPQWELDSKHENILHLKECADSQEYILENFKLLSNRYHFKLANCGKKNNLSDIILHLMMNGLSNTYFPGINSTSQILDYIKNNQYISNKRHKILAQEIKKSKKITLESGDLIKGVLSNTFLNSSLENGIRSSEYNQNMSSSSNNTPLGTDFCTVYKQTDLTDELSTSVCKNYGKIFFIIKYKPERMLYSRKSKVMGHNIPSTNTKNTSENKKLEIYYIPNEQGETHHCIRTAFGLSDVDYIIANTLDTKYINAIKERLLDQKMYIPIVYLKDMKLLFDYDEFERRLNKLEEEKDEISIESK